MRAALAALMLAALLSACDNNTPIPPDANPAPAAATEPAAPAVEPTAPEASAPASTTPEATAPGATAPEANPAAPSEPAASPAAATPSGPAPREGVDYTLIDPPLPLSPTADKIEVVEVFSYSCIHCANLQARITPWEATLPADVVFHYVPLSNGSFEPLARAFYAAQAMGELTRTHEALFTAIAVDHKLKQGSVEELADIYAGLGVDRDAMLSTMASFAVNAQIARNQKTVARWAIEGTPTFIVNGRYRVMVTNDRGHDGLVSTVDHLVARERAARAGT